MNAPTGSSTITLQRRQHKCFVDGTLELMSGGADDVSSIPCFLFRRGFFSLRAREADG